MLPVLHDAAIVGRLDVKTHRDSARLEVKAAFVEPGHGDSVEAIADSVNSLASLVGAETIEVADRGNGAGELGRVLSSKS